MFPRHERSNIRRENRVPDRLHEVLDARVRPCSTRESIQVPARDSDVSFGDSDLADDGPDSSIQDDFGPDQPILESQGDVVLLPLGCKVVLAQAVANQPTEEGLPTAVAERCRRFVRLPVSWVRRPDNVDARSQAHFTKNDARFGPDDQSPHPESRLREPNARAELKLRFT
jgi:hypothetical protein